MDPVIGRQHAVLEEFEQVTVRNAACSGKCGFRGAKALVLAQTNNRFMAENKIPAFEGDDWAPLAPIAEGGMRICFQVLYPQDRHLVRSGGLIVCICHRHHDDILS